VLGVLIIPVLFILFQFMQEKITGAPLREIEPYDLEPGKKRRAIIA
jgi:hypothetical protein